MSIDIDDFSLKLLEIVLTWLDTEFTELDMKLMPSDNDPMPSDSASMLLDMPWTRVSTWLDTVPTEVDNCSRLTASDKSVAGATFFTCSPNASKWSSLTTYIAFDNAVPSAKALAYCEALSLTTLKSAYPLMPDT